MRDTGRRSCGEEFVVSNVWRWQSLGWNWTEVVELGVPSCKSWLFERHRRRRRGQVVKVVDHEADEGDIVILLGL